MKVIYLAGGCFWGAEKYLSSIRGVTGTEVGYANGNTENPSYEQVKHEGTGHAETVRVTYDETVLSLEALLRLFYLTIDPTSVDQQGMDRGHQYRTGIYYVDDADIPVIEKSLDMLKEQYDQPLAIEHEALRQFFTAEEYHQKYLDKNENGYCHVPIAQILWVQGIDPMHLKDANIPHFEHRV